MALALRLPRSTRHARSSSRTAPPPRFQPKQLRYEFSIGPSTFRFYHGDCLTVLPALDRGSIDVIVTSPPYNLGIKYRSYEDDLPRSEYLAWTDQWLRAASKV